MVTVLARLTPQTKAGIVSELGDAYLAEFGEVPSARQLAILAAQVALETGHGKHLWNHNFGNIRGSYNGASTSLKHATEIIDGREVSVPDGFRAYPNAREGARDFLRFLGVDTTPHNNRPNRYQKAWDAACAGDVAAYVRELKAAGYFTASLTKYLAGVERLVVDYMPLALEYVGTVHDTERPPPPPVDPALLADMRRSLDVAETELASLRGHIKRLEGV